MPRVANARKALFAFVTAMHSYFKTDKFRHELADDEIGVVVLGEDCIEWLAAELTSKGVVTQRPVFETWGWTMAACSPCNCEAPWGIRPAVGGRQLPRNSRFLVDLTNHLQKQCDPALSLCRHRSAARQSAGCC